MSIVPLDWIMEDTHAIKQNSKKRLEVLCIKDKCELACRQACKNVKKQRKPNKW